jgi:hypothetical protein
MKNEKTEKLSLIRMLSNPDIHLEEVDAYNENKVDTSSLKSRRRKPKELLTGRVFYKIIIFNEKIKLRNK